MLLTVRDQQFMRALRVIWGWRAVSGARPKVGRWSSGGNSWPTIATATGAHPILMIWWQRRWPASARLPSVRIHPICSLTTLKPVYLPFVERIMKPSTYAGYKTYFERYLKPLAGKYALRDFTVGIVASLLKDIANMHKLNADTLGKIRSILSGIFTYAMSEGHFPARSKMDNPASCARIPESATEPKRTIAATREDVQAILVALKGKPLARAAVGIIVYTGVRPGEARGLRWEEWNAAYCGQSLNMASGSGNHQDGAERSFCHRHN
jgi:integrase